MTTEIFLSFLASFLFLYNRHGLRLWLLYTFQGLEKLLASIEQLPYEDLLDSLKLPMQALVVNILTRRDDKDVKIAVTSCWKEIVRILGPVPSYGAEEMKDENKVYMSTAGLHELLYFIRVPANKVEQVASLLEPEEAYGCIRTSGRQEYLEFSSTCNSSDMMNCSSLSEKTKPSLSPSLILEIEPSTASKSRKVNFPDESHMEKKGDMNQDHSDQTQAMLVSEEMVDKHQKRGKTIVPEDAAEEEVLDVLINFKALCSRSLPKSVTDITSSGKASESKVQMTKCKRKGSSSTEEALASCSTAKSIKGEADSSKASKSKGTRKCFYPMPARAYHLVSQLGQELVDYDIKVWWPADETFYNGTIKAFYSPLNWHRVDYVDNDVELLTLSDECWKFADADDLKTIMGVESYDGRDRKRHGLRKKRKC